MPTYFFKVIPRTFTDQVDTERTIVGISAKINNDIEISIPAQVDRGFRVDFLLATGTRYGAFNTHTSEFANKAIEAGMPEAAARAQIRQIVQGLEFGTDAQIYAAASALAGIYGYTLAPIEEQNGDPLFVEEQETPNPPIEE